MRALLAPALLLSGLLAGCAAPGFGVGEGSPLGPLELCAPTYPDDTAKACERDERVQGTAAPPPGWRCVREVEGGRNGWSTRLQFWTDGARLGVVVRGIGAATHPVGTLWLDGHGPLFWSAADGHLADLGARPLPESWSYRVEEFRSSPHAPFEVRTTTFRGDAWHVYASPDGASADGTVQATVDGRPGPWVSAPALLVTGDSDFWVMPRFVAGGSGWHVETPLDRLPKLVDPCQP